MHKYLPNSINALNIYNSNEIIEYNCNTIADKIIYTKIVLE